MRWISLAVLVAAGVLLAVFWGDVPDRWVTHWGLHDQPNGWVVKSVASAAGPLVIGLLVWLVTEGIAIWLKRGGARERGSVPAEMFAVQATIARAVGLAVALLTACLALALPLLHPRSSLPMLVGALAGVGLVVGGTIAWTSRRVRQLRASGATLPEGYGAAFYKNPRDTRLWVPKLAGIGWTINFAHRLAWPMLIALLGLPLLIALLVALVSGR